jgi:hypothetical protein
VSDQQLRQVHQSKMLQPKPQSRLILKQISTHRLNTASTSLGSLPGEPSKKHPPKHTF